MASKVGRKRKPHRTADGRTIDGLSKRPSDGRWRCADCGWTFSEPDERLAVARFQSHRQTKHDHRRAMNVPLIADGESSALDAIADDGAKIMVGVGAYGQPTLDVAYVVPDESFWLHVRSLILSKPKLVAERTGIEQIGYLAELPKPKPSPSLASVGELYRAKAKISGQERRESAGHWAEFCGVMAKRGITTLRAMTAEAVASYGDSITALVESGGKSPTYARHRFGKIKSIINHARKRGQHPDDCRHALDCCAVLVPPRQRPTNAKPIRPTEFHAMLSKANERMTAALLLGLNLCLAPKEIAAVRWDDLDLKAGTFVSSRSKTGVVRIGMLWPETLAALAKLSLSRRSEAVFTSAHGLPLSVWTLRDDWQKLRQAAGISVALESLKDGAYTAAVEAGIQLDQCRLLAGHRTGISDHYVRRSARMVADACEAIRSAYGVGGKPNRSGGKPSGPRIRAGRGERR